MQRKDSLGMEPIYRDRNVTLTLEDFGIRNCRVTMIETKADTLRIGRSYGENLVRELSLPRDLRLPSVKRLILPNTIEKIHLSCLTLPNLEKVELEGGRGGLYEYQGMLLKKAKDSAKVGYFRLVHSLVQGKQAKITLPGFVTVIGKNAFLDSPCREIKWEEDPTVQWDGKFIGTQYYEILVEEGAFTGSVWEKENGFLYKGENLAYLGKEMDPLCLPGKTPHIYEFALKDHGPERLVADNLPVFLINTNYCTGRASYTIQEIELSKETAKQKWENLSMAYRFRRQERFLPIYQNLERVLIPEENPRYKSVDGVVFSKDGKTLCYYPFGKREEVYRIPEGTRDCYKNLCFESPSLKKLIFPSTMETINGEFHLPQLEELVLLEGVKTMNITLKPRANIVLMEGDSFPRLRILEYLELPASLQSVENSALGEVGLARAHEGTAKGLWSALCGQDSFGHSDMYLFKMITREGQEVTLIRPHLKAEAPAKLYSDAWDGERFQYTFYRDALVYIRKTTVKLLCSFLAVLHLSKEEAGECYGYLQGKSYALGEGLINLGFKDYFSEYLKRGLCTPAAQAKLLALCNQEGRKEEAALLLEYGPGGKREEGSEGSTFKV